jgi:hypothetical protein
MRLVLFAYLLGVLAAVPRTGSAGSVVFSDGTFNEPDWEVVITEVGVGGTAVVNTESSGGNPGSYRRTQIWLEVGGESRVFAHNTSVLQFLRSCTIRVGSRNWVERQNPPDKDLHANRRARISICIESRDRNGVTDFGGL